MGIAKFPSRHIKTIVCLICTPAKAIHIIIVDAEVKEELFSGSKVCEGILIMFIVNPFYFYGTVGIVT